MIVVGGLWPEQAAAKTRSIPLTLDPPLLRAFLIQQVYIDPGARAVIRESRDPCSRIELWDPAVSIREKRIHILSRIQVRAGLAVGSGCLQPVDWKGRLEVQATPSLDMERWQLKFQVVDFRLHRETPGEVSLARITWDAVKRHVHPLLEQWSINLAPPLEQVRTLIPVLVSSDRREATAGWLRSLRPGALHMSPEAIRLELLFEAEDEANERLADPAAGADFPRLEALWELWDPFLVFEILALAGQPLIPEERDRMLGLLLDLRYQFEAAEARDARPSTDLVREQFMAAWKALGPILRKYLVREPTPSLVSYLGFFTVMDALAALDAIGPAFGFEISRPGLVRLARLLNPNQPEWQPDYSSEVDGRLRILLDLGPPIEEPGMDYDEEEMDLPEGLMEETEEGSGVFRFRADPAGIILGLRKPAPRELRAWIPSPGNIDRYIGRIKRLLSRTLEEGTAPQNAESGPPPAVPPAGPGHRLAGELLAPAGRFRG